MERYNLKIMGGRLSFQPMRNYRINIIISATAATAVFIIVPMLNLGHETTWGALSLGIVPALYAIYDFLFRVNVTYEFDQYAKTIYRKLPGLYTRKLMDFEDMHLLPVEADGLLHYAISHKKNKYGKSYTISHSFGSTIKGRKKQEEFETEVLAVVEAFLQRRSG
ncbi:hypothetical protein SNE25_26165 [Mucilaginibacter sabulilitoris]|uniref:DUF304 domain-containing protein n=1 Tax=Mucilaginibacter sabulilitoris TaxID=1173583 RepID=A0ABZ0TJ41_9SPHI|nr:hypothetical protein [Mucilaginibacter sabulilitoris]WPU92814.1 hypothetical protein SNE25_26165 [Mucilaginibacter sabulilitoris]